MSRKNVRTRKFGEVPPPKTSLVNPMTATLLASGGLTLAVFGAAFNAGLKQTAGIALSGVAFWIIAAGITIYRNVTSKLKSGRAQLILPALIAAGFGLVLFAVAVVQLFLLTVKPSSGP